MKKQKDNTFISANVKFVGPSGCFFLKSLWFGLSRISTALKVFDLRLDLSCLLLLHSSVISQALIKNEK